MMNSLKLINFGSKKLKNVQIKSYRLDSELLLSKVLKKKREEILINLEEKICHSKVKEYETLIARRSQKEPIAYITNQKEFWKSTFKMDNSTLIPRPETELLVEKVLKIFKNKSISLLDIGTGSGCIIISLLQELKNARGIGIDISSKAISVAKDNAKKCNINRKIKFLNRSVSDFYNQKFDLVISNPPYISNKDINNLDDDIRKFEPLIGLKGGKDGLDVVKKVIYKTSKILKINGLLALEIGNGQFEKVSKILNEKNFKIKYIIKDFGKNIRGVISILKK